MANASASGYWWKALTTDGITHYFGDLDHIGDCTIVSDEYAPLTRSVDSFGNAVSYFYRAGVDGECLLSSVSWGANANASLPDFATITLSYSVTAAAGCQPSTLIGAQTSYRTGTKIVTGASELDTITVTAYAPGVPSAPVHTRLVTLHYTPPQGVEQTATCSATHAPYRTLYSITESAWGTDSPRVDLPPMTFTYGSAQFGIGNLAWISQTQPSAPWTHPATLPDPAMVNNLGWGYRFNDSRWPTVEAMMIDLDGDGLLDRLSSAPVFTTGSDGKYHIVSCRAQWERNLGPGTSTFASPQYIDLPTLKWASGDGASNAYSGGAYSNAAATSGGQSYYEGCSLNYQRTYYQNSGPGTWGGCWSSNGFSSCPGATSGQPYGVCSDGTDCGKSFPPGGPTYLAYRWIDIDNDGRVDLVASPVSGIFYDLQFGTGINGTNPQQEPAIFGPFMGLCPTTGSTYNAFGEYTMCGGRYPWFIYLNHGGVFGQAPTYGSNPTPDEIVYQPMPLESDSGDSSLTSLPMGSAQGITDVDGDGYPDGVLAPLNGETAWHVYHNDTTRQLARLPQLVAFAVGTGFYQLSAPPTDQLTKTDCPFGQPCDAIETKQGLFDVNGDGMPDHWTTTDNVTATIEINDGLGFLQTGLTTTRRPTTDGLPAACGYSTTNNPSGYPFVLVGRRVDSTRVFDIDLDGRADVLAGAAPQSCDSSTAAVSSNAYLNQGLDFGASAGVIGDPSGVAHTIFTGTTESYPFATSSVDYTTWEIRSDMVDLDGDGIPEGVNFGDGSSPHLALTHVATPTQPPRLLVAIDNGRGGRTTAAYASMSNAAAVAQDASQGKAMPHTQWVVQTLTSRNDVPTTDTNVNTTSYFYKDPHFGVDDQGRYAFRGFEEVTTTAQSGAKTVQRYSYSPDWSGRLATTLVVPAEAPSEVRSIDETAFESHGLFCHTVLGVQTCNVTTFHASYIDHWTCSNGQDEATCRTSAPAFTRSVPTMTELWSSTDGSGPYVWKATSVRLQSSTTPSDGDRIEDTTYTFAADATNYRLLTASVTKSVITSGEPVMYGKTAHSFDSSNRVALTDQVWVDDVDAHRAITRRDYDLMTGNVMARWKPVQNAVNGASETYDYDSRKLFVSADHLEPTPNTPVGEEHDYVYEYGTGTKLQTLGPNLAPCFAYPTYFPGCPTGTPPKEDHRVRVDGLGRVIERYETFMNDGGSSYQSFLVETSSYFDGVGSYVVHQSAINGGLNGAPVQYAQDRTDVDGLGRPIKKTVYTFGWTVTDAITTYTYANDGTLVAVTMPDPGASDASTVTYTYSYDSLGRAVSLRRPDPTSDRSGVDIAYDGLYTSTYEHAGDFGGPSQLTLAVKDNFGRLVDVYEMNGAGGATSGPPATCSTCPVINPTVYTYDAADNVSSVTDPEGVVTSMKHDFAGHRTAITRGDRTWSYTYDLNGNVTSQVSPGYAADQSDIADFTTTIAYDDLDRPTSKVIAPRKLSLADRQLFGSDTETFVYDTGPGFGGNATGRLYYSASYGPGATSPIMMYAPEFTAQGQVQLDYLSTSGIAGLPAMSRSFGRFYNLGGAPSDTYHYDGVGAGSVFTLDEIQLDPRGLPIADDIVRDMYAEQQPYFYIVNTLNVAGSVTAQQPSGPYYGQPGSGGWPAIATSITRDHLGRVSSELASVSGTQVARQDLAYYGTDDPTTLDQYLGSNHKQFSFGFDYRHQLLSDVETTTTGYFSGGYDFTPAGRFQNANETTSAPPNSDVKPRDVRYVYPPTNPSGWSPGSVVREADAEQVWSLVNNSDSSIYASYDYDASGNLVVRCLGALTYGDTPDADTCTGEYWTFLYDGKDQLRRASHFNSSGAIQASEEYWYDQSGTRVITAKRDGSGAVTELIWWIGDMEAHYDATGTVTHVYSYISFGGITTRVDRVAEFQTNIEYIVNGLGGGALAAIDQATGTVNASFSYAPFGEVIEATDGGGLEGLSSHRRHWNDKFVDEVSGLAYYGARFYDKTSMTWTQADPVYRFAPDARWTAPRRGNLYAFSLENPLSFVDPDGRDANGGWLSGGPPQPQPSLDSYVSEFDFDNRQRALRNGEGDWAAMLDAISVAVSATNDSSASGGFWNPQQCDFGSCSSSSCPPGALCEDGGGGQSAGEHDHDPDLVRAIAGAAAAHDADGVGITDVLTAGVAVWSVVKWLDPPAALVTSAITFGAAAIGGGNDEGTAMMGAVGGGCGAGSHALEEGLVATSELEPTHALTLSRRQMRKLTADIAQNGMLERIKYVEHEGTKFVVDGHHRLAVAKSLKWAEVPAQKVELPYGGYRTVDDLNYTPNP